MGTEWACIKRDYEEIDELPFDDEFKVELFQRIYTYVITAGAFLRIHGKEEGAKSLGDIMIDESKKEVK